MNFKILISFSMMFLVACSTTPSKSKIAGKKTKKIQMNQVNQASAPSRKFPIMKKTTQSNPYYKVTAQNFNQDLIQKSDGVLLNEAIEQANKKQYGMALLTVDSIQAQYPKSPKLSKALFLKLKVYKQMNLDRQALSVYAQLKKQYPGAMEAHLAEGLIRK